MKGGGSVFGVLNPKSGKFGFRNYAVFVLSFFVVWVVIGHIFTVYYVIPNYGLEDAGEKATEFLSVETERFDSFKTALLIFLNNVRVGVFIFLLSCVPVLSLAVFLINALIIGVVVPVVGMMTGVSPFILYFFIVPHGVFEIGAMVISGYAGILFFKVDRREGLKYFFLAVVFFFIASLIETFVSYRLLVALVG